MTLEICYSDCMEKNIYSISYKLRRELYHKITSIIGIVFIVFAFVSLVMTFIIFPVVNKSDSMAPDVPAGSYEFVTPLLKKPSRGDVILIQNYKTESQSMVKRFMRTLTLSVTLHKWQPFGSGKEYGMEPMLRRVVGLPGDTIYIDRYVVFVKPAGESHFLTEFEVTHSKYNARILVPPALWDSDLGAKASIQQITLGPDEYFVLGDDRLSSADSRIFGPVTQSSILGKALVLYFPFKKFSFL